MRSQGRLAAAVCGAGAALLGGIAVAGGELSEFSRVRLLGVPLPWLVLGVLVYPVLISLAWFAVRRAERNEEAFRDLTDSR